jgi:hypothetical protein
MSGSSGAAPLHAAARMARGCVGAAAQLRRCGAAWLLHRRAGCSARCKAPKQACCAGAAGGRSPRLALLRSALRQSTTRIPPDGLLHASVSVATTLTGLTQSLVQRCNWIWPAQCGASGRVARCAAEPAVRRPVQALACGGAVASASAGAAAQQLGMVAGSGTAAGARAAAGAAVALRCEHNLTGQAQRRKRAALAVAACDVAPARRQRAQCRHVLRLRPAWRVPASGDNGPKRHITRPREPSSVSACVSAPAAHSSRTAAAFAPIIAQSNAELPSLTALAGAPAARSARTTPPARSYPTALQSCSPSSRALGRALRTQRRTSAALDAMRWGTREKQAGPKVDACATQVAMVAAHRPRVLHASRNKTSVAHVSQEKSSKIPHHRDGAPICVFSLCLLRVCLLRVA